MIHEEWAMSVKGKRKMKGTLFADELKL